MSSERDSGESRRTGAERQIIKENKKQIKKESNEVKMQY